MSATSSSSEKAEQPLYLWPRGTSLEQIKAAVLSLNLPFKVRPFWYEPGKHNRVVALGPDFKHIVDHVYPKTPASMRIAVKWALGLEELSQAHTIEKKMQRIFGDGTVESFEEIQYENMPVIQDGEYVWP